MDEQSVDACDLLCLDLPHAEAIRTALPGLERVEPAAAAARAWGDPTRLTIAAALHDGEEMCVCDMAWVVGPAKPGVPSPASTQGRRHGGLAPQRTPGDVPAD